MRKSRVLGLLLIAALLLPLLVLPASGTAALSFVAVNDTLTPLTLSGEELPFYEDGLLYVPYTAFNVSSLGFYPSYNAADKTMTLFNRNSRLVFDLVSGNVTDEEKIVQSIPAISRNGVVFLPAYFCATHFGVQVSDLSSRAGYQVIRFTTGAQIYDDSLFVEKAENLISYRVSQYNEPVVPSDPPAAPPLPPDIAPSAPDSPQDDPEQDPAQIYLAITDGSSMEESLEILKQHQLRATFFLTAEEIIQSSDLVRRIVAAGHKLGITAPADSADPLSDLQRANEALDAAIKAKTLLALLQQPVEQDLDHRYASFTLPETRLTAAEAAQAYGQSKLLLCDGKTLEVSLAILNRESAVILPLLETSALSS